MVPTDAEAIAITGDDEDGELGAGGLEARRDGGGAAMDGVEAVGVDVVGESAGAADAAGEDDLLTGNAEAGQGLLHLGEDGVVPAARAPADFLVGNEVFPREERDLLVEGSVGASCRHWIASRGEGRR